MQNGNNGAILRVPVAIVAVAATGLFALIATIYLSMSSSIAQAETNISAVDKKYDNIAATVNKIYTNVAIICVTVKAQCQP